MFAEQNHTQVGSHDWAQERWPNTLASKVKVEVKIRFVNNGVGKGPLHLDLEWEIQYP